MLDQIVLLDGRRVDIATVDFVEETHRFYLDLGGTSEDITNKVKRIDKRRFPNFSDEIENLRIYREQNPDAPETGPTTVLGNFVNQIITDPLAAPVESLQRGIGNALETTTGKVMIALVVVGTLAILASLLPKRG